MPDRDTVSNSTFFTESDILFPSAILKFPLTESGNREVIAIKVSDIGDIFIPIVVTGLNLLPLGRKIGPGRINFDFA